MQRQTRHVYALVAFILFLVSLVAMTTLVSAEQPRQIIILSSATPTRTPTPVNIGNFVWDDLDQDGRQDAGEPGLSGVVVQLWNSAKTQLLDQTVTSGTGIYTVTAPTPGSYRMRVVLPGANDNFSPKNQAGGDDLLDSDINPSGSSLGFTDIFTLAANVISTNVVDAGIIKFRTATPTRTPTPVNFGNFVWDDLDQDGRQDAGEPGLSGVVVQLWNSAKTQFLDQTTTNGSGFYTLQSDGPGTFRVRVLLPSASDNFSPINQAGGDDILDSDINPSGGDLGFTDVINIASNVISIGSIDAGIILFRTATPTRTPTPVNIGNFVWDDVDEDGVQDMGEPGLSGVVVQLWNTAKTQLLDQTTTSSTGIYTVTAPTPGSYRVRVVLPNAGDSFSPKNIGSGGSPDQNDSDINPSGSNFGFTDIFNLASNVISTTVIDAGIILDDTVPTQTPTPINLTTRVWQDLNGNGVQDGGEPGIPGVTVRLYGSFFGFLSLLDTEVTNGSGDALLIAPGPNDYRIEYEVDLTVNFTTQNVGDPTPGDDASEVDSDAAVSGSFRGFTTIFDIPTGSPSITRFDAGLLDIPAATFTHTPTATQTPSASPTASNTPTASLSPTASNTPTASLSPTPTSTGTVTIAPPTDIPTDTPTATDPGAVVDTDTPTPTPTDTEESLVFATETEGPSPTPEYLGDTATPSMTAPPSASCDITLSEGAVQGRILLTMVAMYAPDPNTSTNVIIQAGTAWYIVGAQNGYYELWISCNALTVWVPAAFVGPNYDAPWFGAPLPDSNS